MSRRNPLDPYAYRTEPHPFIIQGRATPHKQHEGVHTASTIERAAVYAVQRAMIDGTLAVVFHLDVSGLEPLPDRDAILEAQTNEPTWLFDDDAIREAFESGDGEALLDAIQEYADHAEYQSEGGRWSTWTEAAYGMLEDQQNNAILGVLLGLDEETLLAVMAVLAERRTFPPEIWMAVVGQQRYMVPIGLDRVVQIDALRPIQNELEDTDYPDDDPDQPEVFTDQGFYDAMDVALPERITLWKNPDARTDRVEYHGTDITRARAAFPELALTNPWLYDQPREGVAQHAILGMPMDLLQRMTEEQAARQRTVGVYPVATDTGRLLLGLRSWTVVEPGQWAGFGGSVNPSEDLERAAMRELFEETRYPGPAELEEFAPGLFLAHVPEEFTARLNWETDQAVWFTPEEAAALEPKHWGLEVLLQGDDA